MLRIIVRTVFSGEAIHVGGPVNVVHKTFDVDLPQVEVFIKGNQMYATVEVVGVEVLQIPTSPTRTDIADAIAAAEGAMR